MPLRDIYTQRHKAQPTTGYALCLCKLLKFALSQLEAARKKNNVSEKQEAEVTTDERTVHSVSVRY